MKKLIQLVCIFILSSFSISAQVKTKVFKDKILDNFLPISRTISNQLVLEPPNEFNKLDSSSKLDTDNKFAVSLPTNINFH